MWLPFYIVKRDIVHVLHSFLASIIIAFSVKLKYMIFKGYKHSISKWLGAYKRVVIMELFVTVYKSLIAVVNLVSMKMVVKTDSGQRRNNK